MCPPQDEEQGEEKGDEDGPVNKGLKRGETRNDYEARKAIEDEEASGVVVSCMRMSC